MSETTKRATTFLWDMSIATRRRGPQKRGYRPRTAGATSIQVDASLDKIGRPVKRRAAGGRSS